MTEENKENGLSARIAFFEKAAWRETFLPSGSEYAERAGAAFTLVRKIVEPDEKHDEECLPMYVIQFDDGVEIEAWPDEVLVVEPEPEPEPETLTIEITFRGDAADMAEALDRVLDNGVFQDAIAEYAEDVGLDVEVLGVVVR